MNKKQTQSDLNQFLFVFQIIAENRFLFPIIPGPVTAG